MDLMAEKNICKMARKEMLGAAIQHVLAPFKLFKKSHFRENLFPKENKTANRSRTSGCSSIDKSKNQEKLNNEKRN